MNNLFTQLYIRMAFGLVITIILMLSVLMFLGDKRYESFVRKNVMPVGDMVSVGWLALEPENRASWLELVSSLTNSSWTLNPVNLEAPIEVSSSSWTTQTADVNIRLNNNLAANVQVSNWRDWYIGFGWLLLNNISLQPTNERQAYFEQLQLQVPWQLMRVDREAESLSRLSIRQLKAGQAVMLPSKDQTSDWLYLPAGAEQAIKIGSIDRFEAFSNAQWFGVLTLALTILAIALTLIIRPIYHRIEEIRIGLEGFSHAQGLIKLPTDYSDSLGAMAQHIEEMANSLIKQVEQNRQLNIAVSHDLKTPLARLKFALQMTAETNKLDFLGHMNRDLDLLTNLINELLLYHQLSSTTHDNFEPFNISKALQKQVKEAATDSFEINLTLSHPEISYPIEPTHWRRLSQNLIDNAMQYGNKRMSIHLLLSKDNIELRVNDDGKGLSPDDFESFLMPFQRKDVSRKSQGQNHGLGLSLVHAVCSHYNAQLSLGASALGGCCIVVSLPLALEDNLTKLPGLKSSQHDRKRGSV
ncbi:sensor histidine kinase [Reinekea sp.]|jgi:signal transduction histidine kinase|uniref:sensor histidine kinase n=1 Tax=Reinekea sp. TaxID=1970455 RepID=UPI00398A1431